MIRDYVIKNRHYPSLALFSVGKFASGISLTRMEFIFFLPSGLKIETKSTTVYLKMVKLYNGEASFI